MTARFRCPECNHPLHHRHGDDPTKGCVLKCPECGARLVVPAALAALPQPQIDTPMPVIADDGPEAPLHRPVVLPAMARSMPWLMSACFHVALAMIFMFVAMIAAVESPDIPSLRPHLTYNDDAAPVSACISPLRRKSAFASPRHRGEHGESRKLTRRLEKQTDENPIGTAAPLGLDLNENPTKLIGSPESDGKLFGIGGRRWGGNRLPDVVYLIDRSGSMVDTFEAVRREMLRSIAGMKPNRRFHVVLFADGRPIEKSPRSMTPATDKAKLNLVEFLDPVRASGKTDPIPAINSAFDALEKDSGGQIAVIHLLTDGVFPDNDGVLNTIRRRNPGRRIQINTILYGNRPPTAEKVMGRIAAENGGEYRFISRDE